MNVVSTRGPDTGRDEDALLRDILCLLSTVAQRGSQFSELPQTHDMRQDFVAAAQKHWHPVSPQAISLHYICSSSSALLLNL